MWVKGLQILHKNQPHVVAFQGGLQCLCTAAIMTVFSK